MALLEPGLIARWSETPSQWQLSGIMWSWWKHADWFWVRDTFQLTAMWQASELSSLWLSDVKGQPLVDALCVFIARSKVDQTGKEMEICIGQVEDLPTCLVRLFWKNLEWCTGKRRGCCASQHTEEGYPSKTFHCFVRMVVLSIAVGRRSNCSNGDRSRM